jgi:hypothetical protein
VSIEAIVDDTWMALASGGGQADGLSTVVGAASDFDAPKTAPAVLRGSTSTRGERQRCSIVLRGADPGRIHRLHRYPDNALPIPLRRDRLSVRHLPSDSCVLRYRVGKNNTLEEKRGRYATPPNAGK